MRPNKEEYEIEAGIQDKMTEEQKETFVNDLYQKAVSNPRFMKMKWFNWNSNYDLRELFHSKIGIRRGAEPTVLKSKAKIWGSPVDVGFENG